MRRHCTEQAASRGSCLEILGSACPPPLPDGRSVHVATLSFMAPAIWIALLTTWHHTTRGPRAAASPQTPRPHARRQNRSRSRTPSEAGLKPQRQMAWEQALLTLHLIQAYNRAGGSAASGRAAVGSGQQGCESRDERAKEQAPSAAVQRADKRHSVALRHSRLQLAAAARVGGGRGQRMAWTHSHTHSHTAAGPSSPAANTACRSRKHTHCSMLTTAPSLCRSAAPARLAACSDGGSSDSSRQAFDRWHA